MPEIPECLQRRYKALDELIGQLGVMSQCSHSECMDPSVKLMCNFWSILKDDPDCNLPEEVQQCFQPASEKSSAASTRPTCCFDLSPIQCFLAQQGSANPSPDPDKCSQSGKACDPPGRSPGDQSGRPSGDPTGRQSVDPSRPQSTDPSGRQSTDPSGRPLSGPLRLPSSDSTRSPYNDSSGGPNRSRQEPNSGATPPLTKVLTNLKQAASFDNRCEMKLKELLAAEKYLKGQIAKLEAKEKEGVNLMKEADEMWLGMENSYKERIAQSLERQHALMKQLQEIEKSAAKWRKNRRDLEAQLDSLNKCQLQMVEKINQKTNDLKSIDAEIAAYKTRTEKTKKEAENLKKSLVNRKKSSDERVAKVALEISTLEKQQQEESKKKKNKEEEAKDAVCEARADLQKMCKVLLQRRLEQEDLKSEKLELLDEINLLKDTCKKCKDRCAKKQNEIAEEIKKTDIEIANFELKCFKCHQCVDSMDVRTLCIDCPRCQGQRPCKVSTTQSGDVCEADAEEECVCVKVKKMFLNNIFENMSTVLEKKARTNAGRALGGEILKCLKKSRNAKMNDRTKRLLQDFVLQTVKKNLNLTIVGGAVKTRCELDAATYKQLMLCLKDVKATPPPKSSKGTDVRKDPCKRWGGPRECNCPKGPDNCICSRKAPPPVHDPATCPPEPPKDPGEEIKCPHMDEGPCGPDCGAHDTWDMDRVGADVSVFRPDACNPDACPFGKNMRAAQCVLGPESLKAPQNTKTPRDYSILADQIVCKCGKVPVKPCACLDAKQLTTGTPNAFLKCQALGSIDCKSKPIKFTFDDQCTRKKPITRDDIIKSLKSSKSDICPYLKPINKNVVKSVNSRENEEVNPIAQPNKGYTDSGDVNPFVIKLGKTLNQQDGYTDVENISQFEVQSDGILKIDDSYTDEKDVNPFVVQTETDKSIIEQTNNASDEVEICGEDLNPIVMLPDKTMHDLDIDNEMLNPFIVVLDDDLLVDESTDPFIPHQIQPYLEKEPLRSHNSRTIVSPSHLVPAGWKFIAVRASPSGSLTMELDDLLFNELTETAKLNQDSFIYLNETCSGRYFLDERYIDEMSIVKLQTKLTPEGTIVFDIVSDRIIHATANNPKVTISEKNTSSSDLIEVIKRNRSDSSVVPSFLWTESLYPTEDEKQRIRYIIDLKRRKNKRSSEQDEKKRGNKNKNKLFTGNERISKFFEETLYEDAKKIKNLHVCKNKNHRPKSIDQYKKELQKFYDSNNYLITIDIVAENGVSTKLDTYIQKTSSGNLALDVSNLDIVGEMSNLTTERPVLLRKSPSGNYNLFIGYQYDEDSKAPNAVLRRTTSNSLLIVITEPIMKSVINDRSTYNMYNNKMYGVKLKGFPNDVKIPPAVLRSSPSSNYLIVLDKEFEKNYNDSLNTALDENGECFVELNKTNSNISVNFDKSSKKNAVLVKTSSGTTKILVNGPIFESMSDKMNRPARSSNAHVQDLILEISTVRKSSQIQKTKELKVEKVKSSSESNLYKNTKIRDCLITGTSAEFQRTESGQYAAIVDKKSKNCLLNHLHTHLTHSSPSRVPIKVSDSGEVTIMFSYDVKDQSHFGSLKITPSGNLYIVVDENVLRDIKEKEKRLEAGSEHMIGKIKCPEHKSTTTCIANIKDCVCKPNDCACDHLKVSLEQLGLQLSKFGEQICGYDVTPKTKSVCKEEDCNPDACMATCCTSRTDKNLDKPCSCRLEILDSYYFSESLYRYKDKCLAKEIIEVTNMCNKVLKNRSVTSSRSSIKSVSFDSSSSLE